MGGSQIVLRLRFLPFFSLMLGDGFFVVGQRGKQKRAAELCDEIDIVRYPAYNLNVKR